MSTQEQELFSELHMYMLYIVSKGTSCYTQFRYLILRDTRYLLKLYLLRYMSFSLRIIDMDIHLVRCTFYLVIRITAHTLVWSFLSYLVVVLFSDKWRNLYGEP